MVSVDDVQYVWSCAPGAGRPRLHEVRRPVELSSFVRGGPKDRIRVRCELGALDLQVAGTATRLLDVPDHLLDNPCPKCLGSSRAQGAVAEARFIRRRREVRQVAEAGQVASKPEVD